MRMKKLLAFIIWASVSLVVMILITLPISLQTHLIAGTAVVAAMMLLKAARPHGIWRLIALALGTSIVLRYVYWRTTSTLPPLNQPQDFIPGLLVYGAEMYSVAMLALSLFVVAMPLPSRRAPHLPDEELPTVDIFVPSYNEDRDLLARTLAAIKSIEYPANKIAVYLLDDGGTDQKRNADNIETATRAQQRHTDLQLLCADLDVRYCTRARNEHAKAGNLNNGLKHSSGELIVVFDADHAPARDFLSCTVGSLRQSRGSSSCRRPTSFSTRTRSNEILAPFKRCRLRTRCSMALFSAAWTNGTPRSFADPLPYCAARRSRRQMGSKAAASLRIARLPSNCTRVVGTAFMSISRSLLGFSRRVLQASSCNAPGGHRACCKFCFFSGPS